MVELAEPEEPALPAEKEPAPEAHQAVQKRAAPGVQEERAAFASRRQPRVAQAEPAFPNPIAQRVRAVQVGPAVFPNLLV
jgi:hypothetical protein